VKGQCPACHQEAFSSYGGEPDVQLVRCAQCQKFRIEGSADAELRNASLTPEQRANISGWIVEYRPAKITVRDLSSLKSLRKPTIQARVDRLMRFCVSETTVPGGSIGMEPPRLRAVAYAQNDSEASFYLKHLQELELLSKYAPEGRIVVSAKGHQYVDNLDRGRGDSDVGFCAMWFKTEMDPLWDNAIKPAIGDAGFDPKRIDEHQHNNRIDDEILAWVRRSRFVVADLTGQRAGVYFEAGFAMGLGVPVIWMVRQKEAHKVHFDNRQYNRIEWDCDKLGDARENLLNRIVATIGEGPLKPIATN
jgi:hypothetical protein